MSTLGPFPEQQMFHPRIPTLDLRDAIRMDHGLVPLDEVVPLAADTYSEHPLLPSYPMRAAVKPKQSSEWGIGVTFVVVVVLVIAWAINPAWILGVIVLGGALTAVLKRLH